MRITESRLRKLIREILSEIPRKYDHITSKRQVGSTFKPFVYATAIDQFKYSPCKLIANTQVIFEKGNYNLEEDWKPKILRLDIKTAIEMFLID